MKKIYYNALIINEGHSFIGYVGVSGDRIVKIGSGEAPTALIEQYEESEDLLGKWLLPGVIDDQVHFRDPGLTHKGDISTESRAAVAGGVTSYMDMPNTKPQTVTVSAWEEKMKRASEVSLANYAFFIGATSENIEELKKADYTRIPGIKLFLGASTGNMLVEDESALDEIFSLGRLVAIHSEDETTIRDNAKKAIDEFGEGNVPISEHPKIRSEEACVKSTKRAIERAKRLGTRLHVLHISTGKEISMMLPGDLNGKQITSEVCVHHLWFSDEDYAHLGSRIKWNPAVKTSGDRKALREALNDGRIDIIATDHAPHTREEKQGDALHAASGGPMVQFSLPVMLQLSAEGILSKERVVELMSHNPARLFGIKDRGFLREGYFADMVIVDPRKGFTVNTDIIESKCGWSPLEGEMLDHTVSATIVNGNEVWRDGRFVAAHIGKALEFKA